MEPDERDRADPKTSAVASPAEESKASSPSEQRVIISYLDRSDMTETFADSLTGLRFDGQTLRIEFAVTRMDSIQANAPITGRRYPVCRLVLPPTAAVDLINKMQQIATGLRQAGVVKPRSEPGQDRPPEPDNAAHPNERDRDH